MLLLDLIQVPAYFQVATEIASMAAVVEVGGTRRAAVRSEKFMEWQRELMSSTRAAYGGRTRCEDAEAAACNGIKQHQRRRHCSDEEASKGSKRFEERVAQREHHASAIPVPQPAIGTVKVKAKNQQQQQQRQRSDSKRLPKEPNSESKKVVSRQGKDASEPRDIVEFPRLRRCKQTDMHAGYSALPQNHHPSQQIQQDTYPAQRTRRQTTTLDHEVQSSERNAVGETAVIVDSPSSRATKRSLSAAKTVAKEVPQHPPLKLPKLHLALTRKEIQDDWFKITGQNYSGKPKKSTLAQLGLALCTSLTRPSTKRYLNDPQ